MGKEKTGRTEQGTLKYGRGLQATNFSPRLACGSFLKKEIAIETTLQFS